MIELWTLVDLTGDPILPWDSNPGSNDEGMLVYRSQSAAESAAAHQNEMYDLECVPRRLSEVVKCTSNPTES